MDASPVDAGSDAAPCVCVPGAMESCYTGPDGTLGVGLCAAGTRTCIATCDGFGACMGDVVPETERCDTAVDDDCDGEVLDVEESCVCTPGETESCYTGPDGTLGVGVCVAGSRTCDASGAAWGVCEEEVVPSRELCDDGVDSDCDGEDSRLIDADGDGFVACVDDCCDDEEDCASPAYVNPSALELPTAMGETAVDDDCDGTTDEAAPMSCDDGLALTDITSDAARRAVGLCTVAASASQAWGVVEWTYARANGAFLTPSSQTGIRSAFGAEVVPLEGTRMLTLSTGRARTVGEANSCGSKSCTGIGTGTPPMGFPLASEGCPVSGAIRDDIAFTLTVRVPTNATGITFAHRFYSFEYPMWACDEFNDQFVTIVSPAPAGSVLGNVVFDANGIPPSANTSFISACDAACMGSGFDVWGTTEGSGLTPWLRTTFPVTPGSLVSLRFIIWDSGDQSYDSTVLIDDVRFLTGAVTTQTSPVTP